MSDYRFYDMLRADIAAEIDERSHSVALGLATDYADYKHRVGVIDGMRESLVRAEEIFKKLTGG